MKFIRRFFPENRLGRALDQPGGIKAREALAAAELGVAQMRDECVVALDGKIEQIAALAGEGGETALKRCYGVANEVFSEAGMLGMPHLSAAAHSLCELLGGDELERVPAEAARIHIAAMRLLRAPGAEEDISRREAVLEELKRLSRKFA